MKVLLVNPNTTASMTGKMHEAACAVASQGTEIVAVTAEYGPESIEGYYDEVFSVPAMLDAVKAHPDAAGVVVGCFDDTGVDAARCVTSAPVIGICQAAMQVASIISGSFTVVTTLGRSVPALEHLARRYGYGDSVPQGPRLRDSGARAGGPGIGRPRSATNRSPTRARRGRLRVHRARLRGHGGHGPIALRGAGGAGGRGRDRGGKDRRRSRGPRSHDIEAKRLRTAATEDVQGCVRSIRTAPRDGLNRE